MEKIKDLVRCVFQAEHDVNSGVIKDGAHKGKTWQQVLKQGKESMDNAFMEHVSEEYVEAIAAHIVERGWIVINE